MTISSYFDYWNYFIMAYDWLLKGIHIWLCALFPSNTLHISNLYRIKSWLRIGCVLTQWLWPCGRHFEEVTSRWPRSLGSDVTSCDVIWKILKIIFLLYFCNLGNFTSFLTSFFNFHFFHQVTSLEVTSRWPCH